MKKKNKILMIVLLMAFGKNMSAQWTTVWSDDFEGAINWSATNGVWQTGIPTMGVGGPDSAHSGVKCAGTNLSGNYPVNTTTVLKNNLPFQVPPASQQPRLRFFLWYSFNPNSYATIADYGRVQIKTPSSGWVNLTTYTYTANSSNAWSCEEIDLSAYGDSTVEIGFLLFSGTFDVSTGFYIDDVEIRTGPYTFFNTEDFENGWSDWSAEGSWEIGVPSAGPPTANSGLNCVGTNLNGDYGIESNGHLKSTWIKMPPANQNPAITFYEWHSFSPSTTGGGNIADYGKLQFRTQTSGWIDAVTYTSYSLVWSYSYFSMAAYADSIVQFGFFLFSGKFDLSTGWYIDDVHIDGLPAISTVGIKEDVINFNKIEIYPNPSSSITNIELYSPLKNGKIVICNSMGEIIFEETIINESKKEINLKNIATGIYFVKVSDGEKQHVQKLVVQ